MGRRRKGEPPRYRRHKQSGQAVVSLPLGLGTYKDVLLGPFDTPESRQEYVRILAEWESNGRKASSVLACSAEGPTVNEVILAFWKHAEQHYRRPDGTPTGELREYRSAFKPLRALYGHTAARDFGPVALKAVRQRMIEGNENHEDSRLRPLARGVVNQRIGRIRRMFKWAVAEELVPVTVHQSLLSVPGLQRGRSPARETEPVKSVPAAFVEATLPYLPERVRAMVQLLKQTGMRPGEVCVMRGTDLDTSGKIWFYRPGSDKGLHGMHKTAWHGHDRIVALGPRAQEILRPWLRPVLAQYLFQPKESRADFDARRKAGRKTPMTPSQRARRSKRKPKKAPGDHYSASSLAHAIAFAIAKANAARACDACKEAASEDRCERCLATAIPHWHPNQLRHSFATDVRRGYGLEASQVLLGHQRADVTQLYAERNLSLAEQVAAEIG
jgi:integrase